MGRTGGGGGGNLGVHLLLIFGMNIEYISLIAGLCMPNFSS